MARPPGKTFPVSVMVKTTEAMKARLEAVAARTPFDVSVGFSVVARRAIAIGLEVLERDPRLLIETAEGDAAAALEVLRDTEATARLMKSLAKATAEHPLAVDDPSFAAAETSARTFGLIPLQDAQDGATSSPPGGEVRDGSKSPPRGDQGHG
jgi:hypothetical protein